jgi:porin
MKKIQNLFLTASVMALCAAVAPQAFAADETQTQIGETQNKTSEFQDRLSGDWNGSRSRWLASGLDVTLEYKADIWSNLSGGIKTGNNYIDNLDIIFDIDGEKMFGIQGNKARVYFINNNGGAPGVKQVGSVQGISNIEVGTNSFKLYEAWVDQSFMDDKLSILLGLHDLNTEFAVSDMSANFIKPVMQVGAEMAISGRNGPNVFPYTGLAARVKVKPSEITYVSVAAFDGVPGNPNHPRGTHISLGHKDGALLIAEAGIVPKMEGDDGELNKLAIGVWDYTAKQDDLVPASAKSRNAGVYLLGASQFYGDKEGHKLGAFFRTGFADGDTHQVDWAYEVGLVGNGLISFRKDAEIGTAFTQSHNSDKYMSQNAGSNRSEYGFDIYYRDTVYPGVTLQPEYQYIVNPGTVSARKNASVIGLRTDLNF